VVVSAIIATVVRDVFVDMRSEVVVVDLLSAQPYDVCLQHQAFFSTDHPRSNLALPALQSKGKEMVLEAIVVVTVDDDDPAESTTHPTPACLQHKAFFFEDHPCSDLALPEVQSSSVEPVIVIVVAGKDIVVVTARGSSEDAAT